MIRTLTQKQMKRLHVRDIMQEFALAFQDIMSQERAESALHQL
jgi:hypothetical protein